MEAVRKTQPLPVLWVISAVLSVLCVVPIALPYFFGTGSNATWDWGFIYVTLRFVLLPLGCAFNLIYAVVVAVRSRDASTVRRWMTVVLAPVPLIILASVYSWKNPMPP